MRTLLLVLLMASAAQGATYRPLGFVQVNGSRVLVVERVQKPRTRVIYQDPLDQLWRASGDTRYRAPVKPAPAKPAYKPSRWTP